MNPIQKIRLASRLSKSADQFEEGVKMKNATKIIGAVVASLVAIITASPAIQQGIASSVTAHPAISAAVSGLLTILALIHNPQATAKVLVVGFLALSLFAAPNALAQVVPDAPLPQNVYAAGVSYNNGASPSIAGSALWAHQATDGSGTYAFTYMDVLPVSVKPFTVSTNIGVGIAQKLFTFGKVNVLMPVGAGLQVTGANTGWQWTGGAGATVPVKNNWFIFPNVRFNKGSVSNGAGYQLIGGVMVGWGK